MWKWISTLTITIAQEYMNSALSALDAFAGPVVLVWGVIFAGNTISKQSIFGRLLGFLDKYRSTPLEDWGYHDTFFLMSRVMVTLLGIAVAAGIFFSGVSQ
ncbi:MAG: hypothetical protein GF309_06990 [Candidatus Lokiarchaeota archaeon]|nr:hypothetical protein [Candidatus Lokiarchaeota archaeon]